MKPLLALRSAFDSRSVWAHKALLGSLCCAATVGCAAAHDDGTTSQASDLWQQPYSCGVGPADAAIGKEVTPRLVSTGTLGAEQIACARLITRIALSRGLGEHAAQAAVTASLGGTTLDNLSIPNPMNKYGLFGQSPSPEWGAREEVLDPNFEVNRFFDIMLGTFPNDIWQGLPPNVIAEGVQKSLIFTRYDNRVQDAQLIVDAVSGTSCPGAPGRVVGAIEDKYLALGGCSSVLGRPITAELGSPDNRGRYTVFENGSIYWRDDIGAHEVNGAIRDTWRDLGWETGGLGYPLTDELATPDGIGRYNVFQGGSIYWTANTGAHEVRGAIRDKWASLGWEAGALGYPVAGEVKTADGVRSDFQHGSIAWTRATGEVTVVVNGGH
jgi:hypothetical protein